MKKLTGLERVAKALNLQEPDVIPHWELGIARNVIEAILPGASYRDFAEVKVSCNPTTLSALRGSGDSWHNRPEKAWSQIR